MYPSLPVCIWGHCHCCIPPHCPHPCCWLTQPCWAGHPCWIQPCWPPHGCCCGHAGRCISPQLCTLHSGSHECHPTFAVWLRATASTRAMAEGKAPSKQASKQATQTARGKQNTADRLLLSSVSNVAEGRPSCINQCYGHTIVRFQQRRCSATLQTLSAKCVLQVARRRLALIRAEMLSAHLAILLRSPKLTHHHKRLPSGFARNTPQLMLGVLVEGLVPLCCLSSPVVVPL